MPGRRKMGLFVALGIAIGCGLGMVFHNIPIGTGLGAVAGLAVGTLVDRRRT